MGAATEGGPVAAANPASFRARNPGDYYSTVYIYSMFSLCAIKILILIGVLHYPHNILTFCLSKTALAIRPCFYDL
jgi:hypothetical protein